MTTAFSVDAGNEDQAVSYATTTTETSFSPAEVSGISGGHVLATLAINAKTMSSLYSDVLRFKKINNLLCFSTNSGIFATTINVTTEPGKTTYAPLKDFDFGNSTYVGISDYGIQRSTNATSWTFVTNPFVTDKINTIKYINNLFIILGENGNIATSTDGSTWTTSLAGQGNIIDASYSNDNYYAFDDIGTSYFSSTGNSWSVSAQSPLGFSPTATLSSEIVWSIIREPVTSALGGDLVINPPRSVIQDNSIIIAYGHAIAATDAITISNSDWTLLDRTTTSTASEGAVYYKKINSSYEGETINFSGSGFVTFLLLTNVEDPIFVDAQSDIASSGTIPFSSTNINDSSVSLAFFDGSVNGTANSTPLTNTTNHELLNVIYPTSSGSAASFIAYNYNVSPGTFGPLAFSYANNPSWLTTTDYRVHLIFKKSTPVASASVNENLFKRFLNSNNGILGITSIGELYYLNTFENYDISISNSFNYQKISNLTLLSEQISAQIINESKVIFGTDAGKIIHDSIIDQIASLNRIGSL